MYKKQPIESFKDEKTAIYYESRLWVAMKVDYVHGPI